MNFEETLEYIHSCGMFKKTPGLGRIKELLNLLGNPQKDLRFVHVAGTNGKGSVCAMTESVLRAEGYRTGLFTSPYLVNFEERIRLCGENIPKERLVALTEEVKFAAEKMKDAPSEFELICAIAFLYFCREAADVVVLEVGLGGRLDPTNVIENPLLSVITDIDFDHMAILGDTVQKIAMEKAGIIKEGCPCLYGGRNNSAYGTIRAAAESRSAPFSAVDRSDFTVKSMTLDGTVFDFCGYSNLKIPLLGAYQPFNVAIAVSALELLKQNGVHVSENALREGLATVSWPARFEKLSENPLVIFDGGHNPQGVRAAVEGIQTYFPETKIPIFSVVMKDKDFDGMIEILRPIAKELFVSEINNPRVLSAREYAKHVESHKIPVSVMEDLPLALDAAMESAKKDGVPLLCVGSLYLYKEIISAIKRRE